MEGKFRMFETFWTLSFVLPSVLSILGTVSFVTFGSQVEILAKEYLSSLTEPKEEPESKEPTETQENYVRF